MSLIDLYSDYGMELAPEGHKHYRDGWLNIECPHCSGTEGFHLGFNEDGNYFYCWRCGGHSIPYTISKLLSIRFNQAEEIVKQYRIKSSSRKQESSNNLIKINKKKFKHPSGIVDLMKAHRKYLEKRKFDPDYLEEAFGIKGTLPTSMLDGIPYSYRVLIPIYWKEKEVSFQCRDYSGKQELKYMACPMERELIHHKDILYSPVELDIGIIVEGAIDVWRLRGEASATFGTGFTREQVRVISKKFKRTIILFDPEAQAQANALELQKELQIRGTASYIYKDLETDPGDMSQDDADHLLKELKKQVSGS